jgi:hypothetical protein
VHYLFTTDSIIQYKTYKQKQRLSTSKTLVKRRTFIELRLVYTDISRGYDLCVQYQLTKQCYVGSKWQSRRKLLTNTFHFKTLDMYNVSINKHSQVLARKLLEASAGDKEIDIMNYITLCSLDMICGN